MAQAVPAYRSETPSVTRRTTLSVLGCLLVALVGGALPAAAAPAPVRSYSSPIEALSPYQGQSMCSPTAKPGVAALRDLVLRSYPGTRNLGITRACTVGGRSEHKEGRAFDWGVNVNNPAEKAAADDLLRWLHATDAHGNRFANARRLGIQYVIWNRRIWSSYAPTWRAYTGPSPHTDHVHISFNWPGANKQTSFWTGRVVNATAGTVPSAPPVSTAPAPPKTPVVVKPPPPVRHEQTWSLQSNRATGNSSPYSVQAGQVYLLKVRGTYAPGPMLKADAKCWLARGTTRWTRTGPGGDLGDVLVNNRDLDFRPETRSSADRSCDTTNHVYTVVLKPRRTGVLNLRVLDTSYADNKGTLGVRVSRYTGQAAPVTTDVVAPQVPASTPEVIRVPARAEHGVTSKRSYDVGTKLVVRVSGTYSHGPETAADAECSRWPTDQVWRPVSETDPEGLGHLDLTINGKLLPWSPFNSTGQDCDGRHEYYLRATLSTSGPLRLLIDDDSYDDNSGSLSVSVEVTR